MAYYKNIQKIIPYYPGFPGLPPISPPENSFHLYLVTGIRERNGLDSSELEFDFEWVYAEGELVYKSERGYGSYLKKVFRYEEDLKI